jgi:PKD repeat protein
MMKKILLIFLLLFSPVFAQSAKNLEMDVKKFETPQILPKIDADDFIEIGKQIVFDGGGSKLVSPSTFGNPTFSWDFGDGSRMRWGKQVAHQFLEPGKYVVKLNVKQGREKESIVKEIIVYHKKGILISDRTDKFEEVVSSAGEHGIWLEKIIFTDDAGFSEEEEFIQKIQEKIDFVKEADLLIFYTKSAVGIQSFSQFWQKISPEKKFDLESKFWVHIADDSLDRGVKLLRPVFQILRPKFILLTRIEALNPIFESRENMEILEKLDARAIEFRTIDDRSRATIFLPFSRLTTYFVTHGVSQNVIYLLLAVPLLTFVIAFFRQFIGISTFGVYAPLMLSLSFFVLGLKFGFSVFIVVLLVSYVIRVLFEKVDLLYIPRVSLLLSVLSLSFMLALFLAVYFKSAINLSLAIFPMMVMATVSEKFMSTQSSAGLKNAILAATETVFVALAGYFFIKWDLIENQILAVPELILLPMIGLVWLGKFTGLRLSEYIKFRALFEDESQE